MGGGGGICLDVDFLGKGGAGYLLCRSSLGQSVWQLQQSLLDLEQQLLLPEVVDLEEFV